MLFCWAFSSSHLNISMLSRINNLSNMARFPLYYSIFVIGTSHFGTVLSRVNHQAWICNCSFCNNKGYIIWPAYSLHVMLSGWLEAEKYGCRSKPIWSNTLKQLLRALYLTSTWYGSNSLPQAQLTASELDVNFAWCSFFFQSHETIVMQITSLLSRLPVHCHSYGVFIKSLYFNDIGFLQLAWICKNNKSYTCHLYHELKTLEQHLYMYI